MNSSNANRTPDEGKMGEMPKGFRSGFIALMGAPNSGKSTLLNRLLGEKLSIVSAKPQTTRDKILGIVNLPGAQLLFMDTPGLHEADKALNRHMIGQALAALQEADLAVWLLDSPHEHRDFDRFGLSGPLEASGKPVLAALNKIDITPKPQLLPLMARLGETPFVKEVFAISAEYGDGVSALLEAIARLLPEGPAYYPDDQMTNQPMRFWAREVVREKVFAFTRREIPYSTGVVIESFEEREAEGLAVIHASIYCERESQKAILIGEKGRMIRKIGTAAREDLERRFGMRIFLELRVAVDPGWASDRKGLTRMGYS